MPYRFVDIISFRKLHVDYQHRMKKLNILILIRIAGYKAIKTLYKRFIFHQLIKVILRCEQLP